MRYRVRVFSDHYIEDIPHTVAVLKAVTADRLGWVISLALDGRGKRVVVEDEEEWAAIEAEIAAEEEQDG
jgi:hypothetical protein